MNLPSLLQAEDVVQIDAGSRAMDIGKGFGVSKTLVVIIDKERLEKAISVVDGGDVLLTQVFDETVLMGVRLDRSTRPLA